MQSFIYIGKKKKKTCPGFLSKKKEKKAKQLCQLCRTVLTSLMTETVIDKLFPVLYFFSAYSSAGIPYFLGQPSGPLRGGVTHTNTQRSVCPPALTQRVCLTVSVCGGFIFETGKGQKTTKTAEPSFLLLPLLQLPGDEHSAALILSPSSLNHIYITLDIKIYFLPLSGINCSFKINSTEIVLTHPDKAVRCQITPTRIHLDQTQTGLGSLLQTSQSGFCHRSQTTNA